MNLAGKKILITGSHGMLARDLIPLLVDAGCKLELTDLRTGEIDNIKVDCLNITNLRQVREAVESFLPHWIINCAAYTAVDQSESAQEEAFNVNAIGPANLAKAAKDFGSYLLHISTDYVFGRSTVARNDHRPFTEDDIPDPCGIYGQSKRFGDELVLSLLPERSLIVRTSWLHGVNGPNFVNTILKIAKDKEEIKVVDDQIGSPTWSGWLSEVIVELLKRQVCGVYNVTSRGNISWFDFAKEIVTQSGLKTVVVPQATSELNRPAPRPAFSTLDISKLEKLLGRRCISWQDGLASHLRVLSKN